MKTTHRAQSAVKGFTVVELMLAVAIGAVIVLAIVRLFSSSQPFFQRASVRQTVLLQSRSCMDTILQILRQGKAGTLVNSTPPGTSPNSRVDFDLLTPLASGATAYAIYLSSGIVYAQEFGGLSGTRAPHALVSNVTGLVIAGDSRDPAIVSVSLHIEAPWDSSHDPTHVTTLDLIDQIAHMAENQ